MFLLASRKLWFCKVHFSLFVVKKWSFLLFMVN